MKRARGEDSPLDERLGALQLKRNDLKLHFDKSKLHPSIHQKIIIRLDAVEKEIKNWKEACSIKTKNTLINHRVLASVRSASSGIAESFCKHCRVSLCLVANESVMACPKCGKSQNLPAHQSLTITGLEEAGSSTNVNMTVCHQRARVKDWLDLVQGKENFLISQEHLHSLRISLFNTLNHEGIANLMARAQEIKDERALRGKFSDIEDAEKRLGGIKPLLMSFRSSDLKFALQDVSQECSKVMIQHASKITALLTGMWPPRISSTLQDKVCVLFQHAISELSKIKIEEPAKSITTLRSTPTWPGGYAGFLRRVFLLLGYDEFAALFPYSTLQVSGAHRALSRDATLKAMKWEAIDLSCPKSIYLNGVPLTFKRTVRHLKGSKIAVDEWIE